MYGDGDVPLTVFGVYLEADSALGDRVEVVVMRRTGRVVEQVIRAEGPKELGHTADKGVHAAPVADPERHLTAHVGVHTFTQAS